MKEERGGWIANHHQQKSSEFQAMKKVREKKGGIDCHH
jgi:hypothetical protein